ncbi:hypothetical protein ACHAXS_002632 [Conticribra weissflogii]
MAPLLRSLSTVSSNSSNSYNGKRLRSNSMGWRKPELARIPHQIKRSISNKSSRKGGNDTVFMPPHTVQEFDCAKRVLEKLVKGSDFFPPEAASDNWFGSESQGLNDNENEDGSDCSSCSLLLDDDSSHHEEDSPKQSRRQVPTVHEKYILAGSILGSGGFCEVRLANIDNAKLSKRWHQSCLSASSHFDGFPRESANEFLISEAAESKNASMTKFDEIPEDGQGYFNTHHSDNPGVCKATYAMKYLSPTKFQPRRVNDYCPPTAVNKEFERAIADLVTEARFLSMLSHPNIITLHYVSEGNLEDNFNCGENLTFYIHQYGYFLLLDKLHETLSHRINNTYIPSVLSPCLSESSSKSSWWKKVFPSAKSRHLPISEECECSHSTNNNDELSPKNHLANRLSSLKCIASALSHMHQRGIISRDVKSDNIGFHRVFRPQCSCGHRCTRIECCICYEDIPKLFDFGLCRELKTKLRVKTDSHVSNNGDLESLSNRSAGDTFKLTGLTGSRRWMAPEVACCLPYNQKADVYSFGLVLYHVTSLLLPFDGFTLSQLEKEVAIGGHRPDTTLSKFSTYSFSSCKRNSRWTKNRNSNDEEMPNIEKNIQLALKTLRVWPKDLKCLIEECWDNDLNCRPEMSQVEHRIDTCIHELNQENSTRIGPVLRRISIRRSSCNTPGSSRSSIFSLGKDDEDKSVLFTRETFDLTNENNVSLGGPISGTLNIPSSKCDESNHRRPSFFSCFLEDDMHHIGCNSAEKAFSDGYDTEVSKSECSVVAESSRRSNCAT